METRHPRRGERLAVAALVVYSLVLAFLIGPAIRGALATGEEPVADLAAAPAAVGVEATGQAVGGPPAAPGLAVAAEAAAEPADVQVVPQLSGPDEKASSGTALVVVVWSAALLPAALLVGWLARGRLRRT